MPKPPPHSIYDRTNPEDLKRALNDLRSDLKGTPKKEYNALRDVIKSMQEGVTEETKLSKVRLNIDAIDTSKIDWEKIMFAALKAATARDGLEGEELLKESAAMHLVLALHTSQSLGKKAAGAILDSNLRPGEESGFPNARSFVTAVHRSEPEGEVSPPTRS